jgi:hypothetical protein
MIPNDRAQEVSEPLAGAGLSDWQKQQLAERLAEVEHNPGVLLPAAEVEAELRALLLQPNPV